MLLEVPAVAVETGGKVFGELLLNHMKYAQLLLAANLNLPPESQHELKVEFVDLKSACPTEQVMYKRIDYDGIPLAVWRVGAPFEYLVERTYDADIVGISANYTYERGVAAETIRVLRQRTKAYVVVGGHDATADPRYYLERGAHLCILGEGETALAEVAAALQKGDTSDIPGTAYVIDGNLKKNGKRQSHDLNTIRYLDPLTLRSHNFDECPDGALPFGVSPRMAVLETSRGCDERCSFCDSSYIVGKYRSLRLENLTRQLNALDDAGIHTVLFADDNLLYRMLPNYGGQKGRAELISFFRDLINRGFAWTFYNGLQFGLFENRGTIDLELIDVMFMNKLVGSRFSGCFRAYVPLEKFTQPEMMLLPKLRPLPIAKAILAKISQKQVPQLNLGFIIGNIRETPGTLAETIAQARHFGELVVEESMGKSTPKFFPWCSVPIPGTPDHKAFTPNIVYAASEQPELYSNYTSVLSNCHFSPSMFTFERERISNELNHGAHDVYSIDRNGLGLSRAIE